MALAHVLGQIRATAEHDSDSDCGQRENEKTLLSHALEDVQEIIGRLTTQLLDATEEPVEVCKIGLNAVRFLSPSAKYRWPDAHRRRRNRTHRNRSRGNATFHATATFTGGT